MIPTPWSPIRRPGRLVSRPYPFVEDLPKPVLPIEGAFSPLATPFEVCSRSQSAEPRYISSHVSPWPNESSPIINQRETTRSARKERVSCVGGGSYQTSFTPSIRKLPKPVNPH